MIRPQTWPAGVTVSIGMSSLSISIALLPVLVGMKDQLHSVQRTLSLINLGD